MDYFINPIWFYWLGVCDGLKTFAIVLAALAGCTIIGFISSYIYNYVMVFEYKTDSNKQYMNLCKTGIKWSVIVFIPLLIIAIFAPGKQTMIEMQVASIATKTNAEWSVEQLKGITDYIIERINSVQ